MVTPRNFGLYELLDSVQKCIESSFIQNYWVRAEVSDLRIQNSSGHCYLELLERGTNGSIIAKARATIWSGNYMRIASALRSAQAPPLSSGIAILALVSVNFHPVYGLSLSILDVDPNYTLGEIARQRMQTIEKLKAAGIYEENKKLKLPRLVQRLAIISSPTAAGYGDFMRHLHDNPYGFVFYTALFPAQMQGEQTSISIRHALDIIGEYAEDFDAVILIRGGGAVSELRAFDDYALAESCAQYPIPILAGIGHERDQSVVDLVANSSFKTPTAVADFLLHRALTEYQLVGKLADQVQIAAMGLSQTRRQWLERVLHQLPLVARQGLHEAQHRLERRTQYWSGTCQVYLQEQIYRLDKLTLLLPNLYEKQQMARHNRIEQIDKRLPVAYQRLLAGYLHRLEHTEQFIRLADPVSILQRGYALVQHQGHSIVDSTSLSPGDKVVLRLYKGSARATISSIQTE